MSTIETAVAGLVAQGITPLRILSIEGGDVAMIIGKMPRAWDEWGVWEVSPSGETHSGHYFTVKGEAILDMCARFDRQLDESCPMLGVVCEGYAEGASGDEDDPSADECIWGCVPCDDCANLTPNTPEAHRWNARLGELRTVCEDCAASVDYDGQ